MPITIDSQNPLKDIEKVQKEFTSTLSRSPKFFSSKLTGSGGSKGLISKKVAHLGDQLQNHGHDLAEDSALDPRMIDDIIEGTLYLGTYSEDLTSKGEPLPQSKSKQRFIDDVNKRTNMYEIKEIIDLETINPLLMNDINLTMDLPLNTVLWDLNNIEDWTIIGQENGKALRAKLLFSHVTLFQKETNTASGNKTQKNRLVFTPFLLTDVSNVGETPTHLTINKDGTDPKTHRVRITPIRIGQEGTDTKDRPTLTYGFGFPGNAHSLDLQATAALAEMVSDTSDIPQYRDDLLDYIAQVPIYETLSEQAERYQEHSMDQFVRIVKELSAMHGPVNHVSQSVHDRLIASFYSLVNKLEDIEQQGGKIKTDELNKVYEAIVHTQSLNETDKTNVLKQSLRLLLAHRLNKLSIAKDNGELYDFQPFNDQIKENVEKNNRFSKQQKEIILTEEPLSIGQAGAGSGKSTTVTGRIHYLQAQQEDLNQVLVLSFTNVAAQNITNRFPGIKSRTLADMFHSIYKNSFLEQHLSTPGTLMNSLRLLNPYSAYFTTMKGHSGADVEDAVEELSTVLSGFANPFKKNNDAQSNMRQLMNVVNEYPNIIVDVLDAVEQTTLELEQIIIHHYLNNDPAQLVIPQEFQDLNMIITDESQDISTFEYIMLIDMALHYGCQLLIVGDGSQTLYEFRNSDPRYLNALEASGVFATYKLETNYRSNGEILTMANQFLNVIEANDVANIQLRPNSLKTPTVDSFKDKVTVYSALPSADDRKGRQQILEDHLLDNPEFKAWFYEKIDNNEQVAFLAHTRRDVKVAEDALNELLSNYGRTDEATNIVSKRIYEKKYISDVLLAVRDDFVQINPGAPDFMAQAFDLFDENDPRVLSCFRRNITGKQLAWNVQDIRDTFSTVVKQPQIRMMCKEVAMGQRNGTVVMNAILQNMLREETRQNNMKHVLEPKEEIDIAGKAVIVATIHAAKGLEFDHTIVLHHQKGSAKNVNEDKMQEQFRMQFVALSRAKKSEWIINTQLKPSQSISDQPSAMYSTPMATAYLRANQYLRDVSK